MFAQLFVAILLRAGLVQSYLWYREAWIILILLVGNVSVAFAEPVVFVGLVLLAVVRDASNKGNDEIDVATRQASERRAANAECRVLEEDRKTFIDQLRRPECREAMVTAAQNARLGAEREARAERAARTARAYLAVQQILYQPSDNAALELVTLPMQTAAPATANSSALPDDDAAADATVVPHEVLDLGVHPNADLDSASFLSRVLENPSTWNSPYLCSTELEIIAGSPSDTHGSFHGYFSNPDNAPKPDTHGTDEVAMLAARIDAQSKLVQDLRASSLEKDAAIRALQDKEIARLAADEC